MRRTILTAVAALLIQVPPVIAQQKSLTLSEVVNLGRQHNLRLQARARDVASLESTWRASRLLFNPSVGLETGRGESYDGTVERTVRGISLSQQMENPFTRRARIHMAENEWRAAEAARRNLALDITYDITEHFLRILLLEERVELARRSLESFEQAHQLISRRLELGEATELEALKLEVEVMRARTELSQIEVEERLVRQHLDTLVGNSLPEDFEPAPMEPFRPLTVPEEVLLEQALNSHPRVERAEYEIARARDHLRATRSSPIPGPELTGFLHDELDGRIQGIGIAFALPLWNMAGRETAAARTLAEGREYDLEALKLELISEISIRYSWLALTADTIELFEEGLLRQAEESLRIAETSYRAGEISLLAYLDARRTYFQILNDYQDALYAWYVNRAALERAVGEEIR